jgi:hypothetical protein
MSYQNTYTVWDFVGGFPPQSVRLWWTWTSVNPLTYNTLEADRLTQPNSTGPMTRTIESQRDLTPPASHWDVALSIQDDSRVSTEEGWIFRSGGYVGALPVDPIEVVLAAEEFFTQADIDAGLPTLPLVNNTVTINGITAMITSSGLAFVATGTDSTVSGVTFTYTATLILFPNANITKVDEPIDIGLTESSISFSGGIIADVLNIVSGIILRDINPLLRATLKTRLNASIIAGVASKLSRQPTTSLPAGVVMSLRRVRFTTRNTASGSEQVIGILGALGAFGGVVNKFAPISNTRCFIATAASGSNAVEVQLLREFRDNHLLQNNVGRFFIKSYEYFSPPLANVIARSSVLRTIARRLIVTPTAFLVRVYNRSANSKKPLE